MAGAIGVLFWSPRLVSMPRHSAPRPPKHTAGFQQVFCTPKQFFLRPSHADLSFSCFAQKADALSEIQLDIKWEMGKVGALISSNYSI